MRMRVKRTYGIRVNVVLARSLLLYNNSTR